jgi:hypothetical protein
MSRWLRIVPGLVRTGSAVVVCVVSVAGVACSAPPSLSRDGGALTIDAGRDRDARAAVLDAAADADPTARPDAASDGAREGAPDAAIDGGPGAGRPCGEFAGACPPGERCDLEGCRTPGLPGVCRPLPVGCDGAPAAPICGCDGATYASECEANRVGVDVLFPAACDDRDPCTPMNARGERSCDLVLGFAWNGDACERLTGCVCRGDDCGDVFSEATACAAAYAECGNAGFPCGDLECTLGAEHCEQLVDPSGELATLFSCVELPSMCSRHLEPTCDACFPALPEGATCTSPEVGALVVTRSAR